MLTMKDIIRDGHPTLRKVAEPIPSPINEEDKEILQSLLTFVINSQDEAMIEKYQFRSGIGLAAPQINISKRMLAIHLEDANGKLHSYALYNPKIISHSVEKSYISTGEGCLSVDENIPGLVHRHARITVVGYDENDNEVKLRLSGLPAIAMQHEIDHLNGIMFYDHINKDNPLSPLPNAIEI